MNTSFFAHLRLLLFVCALSFLAVLLSGNAYAQGTKLPIRLANVPSNDFTGQRHKVTIIAACFAKFTGLPVNVRITHSIVGIKPPADCNTPDGAGTIDKCNNGGHTHQGGPLRPHVFNPPGELENPADLSPVPLVVVSQQFDNPDPFVGVIIDHQVPQASGVIAVEGEMLLPRGWRCEDFCFDPTSWQWEGFVHVRPLATLTQLPGAPCVETPDHYIKERKFNDEVCDKDPNHRDAVAYAGTPFTLQALSRLARNYHRLTNGIALSVNDMSLPKGGVFDLDNDWRFAHREHRDGTDADINRPRINGQSLNCKLNKELRQAVDQVLVGKFRLDENGEIIKDIDLDPLPFSALLCENSGFNHIDFTDWLDLGPLG